MDTSTAKHLVESVVAAIPIRQNITPTAVRQKLNPVLRTTITLSVPLPQGPQEVISPDFPLALFENAVINLPALQVADPKQLIRFHESYYDQLDSALAAMDFKRLITSYEAPLTKALEGIEKPEEICSTLRHFRVQLTLHLRYKGYKKLISPKAKLEWFVPQEEWVRLIASLESLVPPERQFFL